jgi:hypothetical protein
MFRVFSGQGDGLPFYKPKEMGGPRDPPISFNHEILRKALRLELPPIKGKPEEPGTK